MPAQPSVIIITPKSQKKGKGGKLRVINPNKTPLPKITQSKIAIPVRQVPVISPDTAKQVHDNHPAPQQRNTEKEKSWRRKLADCRKKCNELEKGLVELEEILSRLEGLVNPGGKPEVVTKVKVNGSSNEDNFLTDLLAIPAVSNLVMGVLANLAK
ncbi:MAG: hypothetical protein ACYDG6_04965 [Thermincolia bacterium]